MNPISWNNFLTYGLQIGLLVGLAGWIPAGSYTSKIEKRT